MVGNGILTPKRLSLNYIRNNIVVCDGGATDLDAIKSRFGIHYLWIREGDLWVAGTFRLDLSRTTKWTTIKTSNDDSPAHVTVNGSTENKTIQTSSIPQIRNLQTTPVKFRLGIEEISLPTHQTRLHLNTLIFPTTKKQASPRPQLVLRERKPEQRTSGT